MSHPSKETLARVARERLTSREQRDFEECLDRYVYEQDLGPAQWYVMIAVESHCSRGHISEETAQKIYGEIGLCPVKKSVSAHA